MTVDVFGDGVDDNIGAMIEGVLEVRAEEGVVDDDHDAMLVGDGGDGADVDEAQGGVAGAFDPDKLGLVGADEVGDVDLDAGRKGHLDAVGGGDFGEVSMGAAVDVRDGDDVGALGQRLQDERRRGGS